MVFPHIKNTKRSYRICFLASLLVSLTAHAETWPATKYPFLPSVSSSTEPMPAVCGLLAEQYRRHFLTQVIDLGVNAHQGTPTGLKNNLKWVEWRPVILPSIPEADQQHASDRLYRADLDIDNDGNQETVVYRANEWSWRGATYQAYVYPSPKDFERQLAENKKFDELLASGAKYYPSGDKNAFDWQWNNLFSFERRFYFLGEGNSYWRTTASHVPVYRLSANGESVKLCEIQVLPDKEQALYFSARPAIASYLDVLWNIGGAGGGDCGTLHAEVAHDGNVEGAILRAATRPWITSAGGLYDTGDKAAFIRDWGYTDAWSLREYQTYLEHREPARLAIAQYLVEAFGLTAKEAEVRGQEVFETLTSAFFMQPSSYPQYQLYEEYEVRRQIAEGGLPGQASADASVLSLAVENRKALERLLTDGAPVDAKNEFGKTALMYAAHLNRPDSVEMLLRHGADPNALTQAPRFSCGYYISRVSRSALTYAAENASIETMAILVKAGAKVDVTDSTGNNLSFYLARNPRLTERQRKQDIRQLIEQHLKNPPKGPSFACTKATTKVEKAICADEVLAMFDRELADAYSQWRQDYADKAAIVRDQAQWLKRRAATCGNRTDEYSFVHCLQQATRARVRYLHNRISEKRGQLVARELD